MAYKTCSDCGSKMYGGHCVNCHEETYIAEQNYSNDEPIVMSNEFNKKVSDQAKEAKKILEQQKEEQWKIKIA